MARQEGGSHKPRNLGGKPRTLDRRHALDQAIRLFLERGYEGTSFRDLIDAMKVGPSSFYFAFGSKEKLFRAVVDCYAEGPAAFFVETIEAKIDARSAFVALLEGHARLFTLDDRPPGCPFSFAFAQAPPELEPLRELTSGIRKRVEAAMADRLRRGIAEGDLPADVDADGLAAFFETVFRGMAVKARDGASREKLLEIGRLAMQVWPQPRESARGMSQA